MKRTFVKKYPKPILSPKGFPFFYFNGNWEGRWVYHPRVIQHKGKFYLFYSGKSGFNMLFNKALQMRQDIGVVTSKGLKKWQRQRNPVLSPSEEGWDSDLVCHAHILRQNKKFYMFYDGSTKGKWREAIGVAESNDLINWTKMPRNPVLTSKSYWWDKAHVSRCSVIKRTKVYYMFFAGHDGERERIGVAKSRDLTNWEKLKEPVVDIGSPGEWDEKFISDPSIVKIGSLYLMSYTGYKGKYSGIGLAISRDLIKWKKFSQNPILKNGKKGSWDEDEANRADFVKIGKKYYLFYTGVNGFKYSIGMAEVKMDKLMKAIKNEK